MTPEVAGISFDPKNLFWQLPMLMLAVTGIFLVLAEAFASSRRAFLSRIAVTGCVLSLLSAVYVWRQLGGQDHEIFAGMLVVDRTAVFFFGLFAVTAALSALTSTDYLREHDFEVGEYYAVMLISATGMAVLAMANDLMSVFLGIETMSLGAYVLTASRRNSRRSSEGALKYFLMGAFATGFLLYGIALVYGAVGSTHLPTIAEAAGSLDGAKAQMFLIGVFLLVVSFAFKVGAVPFHMWTPDAYEGAPAPVTGFMAAGVKAGAFVAIIRVFGDGLGGDLVPLGKFGWATIFAVIAAVTMVVGNAAALRQENVKRMLAYSSIAHAGTLLVGVVAMGAGAPSARASLAYYLAAYTVTTLGAFAVVSWIGNKHNDRENVDDWAGLASQHPGAALAMTVCLLSLGGIPPTAGFFGKFYVFKSAMEVPNGALTWLVVLGVLNSAVSIFYYLRVVTAMYFRDALKPHEPLKSPAAVFAFVVATLLVLEMGLFPGFWLGLAG